MKKMSLHSNIIQLMGFYAGQEFPTNEPIITKVRMGTAGLVEFQLDTVASHSILTYEAYERLRNMPYGDIPNLRPETSKIRLVDGSSSNMKIWGSVSIRCEARNSGSKMLDFYAMDAPVTY